MNLDELGEGVLDEICNILKERYLSDFHNGESDDIIEWLSQYESHDKHYSMRIVLKRNDKHSCNGCIYLDNLNCLKGLKVSNWHYCRSYETHKSCWECKNIHNYGADDSWCDLDLHRVDESYRWNDNEDNKCPDWELDRGEYFGQM